MVKLFKVALFWGAFLSSKPPSSSHLELPESFRSVFFNDLSSVTLFLRSHNIKFFLLLQVLSNWQRFRDEQLILLNWLSSKEKTLKDMGRTDLTDEDEVKEHLEKLRVRDIYCAKRYV